MRHASLVPMLCAAVLAACGDSAAPASTITLNGRLIDQEGLPLTGATVLVNGKGGIDASNGFFSVSGVTVPYEVTVSRATVLVSYRGLTRADPTLQSPYYWQGYTDRSGWVGGKLSGGVGYPEPSGHFTQVVATEPYPGAWISSGYTGEYWIQHYWRSSGSTTVNVYALQQTSDVWGRPVSYDGYGFKRNVTLTDGASSAGQDLALSPVAAATFSGSVTIPVGYHLSSRSVFLRPGPGKEVLRLTRDTSGAATFSDPTPVVPGATLSAGVWATKGPDISCGRWLSDLPVNASGVDLTVLPAPEMSIPVSGANDVDMGTWFRFFRTSGVSLVALEPEVPTATAPAYFVMTTDNSVTIPDGRTLGLGLDLPRGTKYRWTIYWFGMKSADDAAGPAGYAHSGFYLFPEGSVASCTVGPRSITTAP